MRKLLGTNRITKNDRGSAIVTVVVSMLFVMALGAALLFAAYTGYSVEITQRGDKDNFYDAGSAMDDMRLGVQTLLSEAVSVAYTDALTNYFTTIAAGNDPQTAFNDNITAQLLSKAVTSGGTHYFTSTTIGGKTTISGYNVAAMAAFIAKGAMITETVTAEGVPAATFIDAQGATVTIIGSSAEQNSTTSAITIKSISVKYISANGYESNITSDIAVTMPYFFASSSVASSINNYAIIAHDYIEYNAGSPDVTVSGSVFAGNNGSGGITASNGGKTLTFTDGDLICKGSISVHDLSTLVFAAPENELWTNDINIGVAGTPSNMGTAALNGNIYVADDLALLGNNSSVTLKNSYFGFGDDAADSKNSSSILINGRESTLDITDLENLSLAGVSFIETNNQALTDNASKANFTSAIRMGQSLSVTSDQLAYLVPLKCITNYASNPCVFDIDATLEPDIDMNTVLWGTGDDEKKLSDYVDASEIKTLYRPLGDGANNLVYVFLVFADTESANTYFKDYFAADSTKISQYISLYLTSIGQADKTSTAGNMYYTTAPLTADPATSGTLKLSTASSKVYAAGAQLLYSKMVSPYGIFVNELKMDTLSAAATKTLEFTNTAGEVVAIVAAEDYVYDGSKSSIRLIISSKNVTVHDTNSADKTYHGVIIAGTDVILQSDVTGQMLSSDIIGATCTVDGKTYKLSDFLNNSAQLDGSSNASEDLWNLDTLVYYENWDKH